MASPFGPDAVLRHWWAVGLAGALWTLLGLFFLANAFSGSVPIRPGFFAIPLALDGLLSVAAASGRMGGDRIIRVVKAGFVLAVAIVIVATDGRAEMAVGILVGAFLITDAAWRCASACLDRFDVWRRAIAYAVVEALLGFWSLLSYPAGGALGSDVSLLVMNSGLILCMRAMHLRQQQGGGAFRVLAEE